MKWANKVEFIGITPTNKAIGKTGMSINKVMNEKIVKHDDIANNFNAFEWNDLISPV